MEKMQGIIKRAELSHRSNVTSPNTPLIPEDEETAALLSSIIDRSRMAMGWNRLPQSNDPKENSEQDVAIVTWYEILKDAGVPSERWNVCYRAAQQRKVELRAQGKESGIVTPNDLVVEWLKIRNLNAELDNTRLIPENAAAACERCFGTGKEQLLGGGVKDDCSHLPLTEAEQKARIRERVAQIQKMREVAKAPNPKPVLVEMKPKGVKLRCSECKRKANTLMGWAVGEDCNQIVGEKDGKPVLCDGKMESVNQ